MSMLHVIQFILVIFFLYKELGKKTNQEKKAQTKLGTSETGRNLEQ